MIVGRLTGRRRLPYADLLYGDLWAQLAAEVHAGRLQLHWVKAPLTQEAEEAIRRGIPLHDFEGNRLADQLATECAAAWPASCGCGG